MNSVLIKTECDEKYNWTMEKDQYFTEITSLHNENRFLSNVPDKVDDNYKDTPKIRIKPLSELTQRNIPIVSRQDCRTLTNIKKEKSTENSTSGPTNDINIYHNATIQPSPNLKHKCPFCLQSITNIQGAYQDLQWHVVDNHLQFMFKCHINGCFNTEFTAIHRQLSLYYSWIGLYRHLSTHEIEFKVKEANIPDDLRIAFCWECKFDILCVGKFGINKHVRLEHERVLKTIVALGCRVCIEFHTTDFIVWEKHFSVDLRSCVGLQSYRNEKLMYKGFAAKQTSLNIKPYVMENGDCNNNEQKEVNRESCLFNTSKYTLDNTDILCSNEVPSISRAKWLPPQKSTSRKGQNYDNSNAKRRKKEKGRTQICKVCNIRFISRSKYKYHRDSKEHSKNLVQRYLSKSSLQNKQRAPKTKIIKDQYDSNLDNAEKYSCILCSVLRGRRIWFNRVRQLRDHYRSLRHQHYINRQFDRGEHGTKATCDTCGGIRTDDSLPSVVFCEDHLRNLLAIDEKITLKNKSCKISSCSSNKNSSVEKNSYFAFLYSINTPQETPVSLNVKHVVEFNNITKSVSNNNEVLYKYIGKAENGTSATETKGNIQNNQDIKFTGMTIRKSEKLMENWRRKVKIVDTENNIEYLCKLCSIENTVNDINPRMFQTHYKSLLHQRFMNEDLIINNKKDELFSCQICKGALVPYKHFQSHVLKCLEHQKNLLLLMKERRVLKEWVKDNDVHICKTEKQLNGKQLPKSAFKKDSVISVQKKINKIKRCIKSMFPQKNKRQIFNYEDRRNSIYFYWTSKSYQSKTLKC